MPSADKAVKLFKKKKKKVFAISALSGIGLKPLLAEIFKRVETVKEEKPVEVKDVYYKYNPEFEVLKSGDIYEVFGKKIADLVAMTNFTENEAVKRFQNILKKIGVDQKLKEAGIKTGDTVRAGNHEFNYSEY